MAEDKREQADTPSNLDDRYDFSPRLVTDFSHLKNDNPGKSYRLVNDEGGNVEHRLRQGWVLVEGKGTEGSYLDRQKSSEPSKNAKNSIDYVQIQVGQTKTRSDCTAVLMSIDAEVVNKIRERKRYLVEQSEKALQPSSISEKESSSSAFSVPLQGAGLTRTN
jgi:hypothetical protein